ncbi:MAG: hypothetical protein ACO1RT_07390 [Planctomycetaceae bacterium]
MHTIQGTHARVADRIPWEATEVLRFKPSSCFGLPAGWSVCVVLSCIASTSIVTGQALVPVPVPLVDPLYPPYPYDGFPQFGGPLDPRFPPLGFTAPRSVLIDSKVVASPPLPPARVVLMHRRNEPLHVEVFDRKQHRSIYRGEVSPGAPVELSLPRDAGGYVRDTYRSVGLDGRPVQREVIRALPSEPRYDVVVHRWQVQSIAIDRTGKSPSAVEDVQFHGQPLGRFSLPAGSRLIDGQLDVYRNAVAAGNQAVVAPLSPATQDDGPSSDPLGQAIRELNRQ